VTADQLLQWTSEVVYVLVATLTVVAAIRGRSRTEIDVALFFGAGAVIVLMGWVTRALGVTLLPALTALATALLMAMPYLLLRLLDDFAGVRSWLMRGAEVLLLVLVVVPFVAPLQALPRWLALLYIADFAGLAIYASAGFISAARRSQGVTRRRLQAVGAGSLLLGLAVATAAGQFALPGLALLWTALARLAGLGSGIAYYLGFAPPRWLRQAWQGPELRTFLAASASAGQQSDVRAAAQLLERSIALAFGAARATIELWDGEAQRRAPGQHDHGTTGDAKGATLAARLMTGGRQLGTLTVHGGRPPLLAKDDLELLMLLADQVAATLAYCLELQESERVRAELQERERQLADAQRIAHLGSWEWDLRTDRVTWSQEAYRIRGLEPDEVRPTYEAYLHAIHPDDRARVDEAIQRARQERAPFTFEHRVLRPDGSARIVRSLGEVVVDASGEVRYLRGTSLDVTETREAEEALRVANAELEQFAYSVSHDLKGPLVSIQGFAQELAEGNEGRLDERSKLYVSRIGANAEHLNQLIDDVLAFSRVGRTGTAPEPVPLDRLVHEALDALAGPVAQTGASVLVQESLPVVVASPLLLEQVLLNLLGNAVAYGANAGEPPRVEVGCDDLGRQWRLWVRDHGPGIAVEHQERIFRLFERLSAGVVVKPAGTGLGLGIVRKAADCLGGAAGVESAPGGGATFWVMFPKVPADLAAAERDAAQQITRN
jgi:PAS domain S-box-containing protein